MSIPQFSVQWFFLLVPSGHFPFLETLDPILYCPVFWICLQLACLDGTVGYICIIDDHSSGIFRPSQRENETDLVTPLVMTSADSLDSLTPCKKSQELCMRT